MISGGLACAGALANNRQDRLEDALLNAMGKQKQKWVVVDMERELNSLWLDRLFPEEVCNSSCACSECIGMLVVACVRQVGQT
jgi:hypothetical protein